MRHETIETLAARLHAQVTDPFLSSGSARICRAFMAARSRRREFFKASLFSDPAWDILLELFAADAEGQRLSISAVGLTANIPKTTALRWVNALECEGLVQREDDPLDARRIFLGLSEQGVRTMSEYFLGDTDTSR